MDRYGKIPEPILGRMAVRIVQGLIYMWSLKILHRGKVSIKEVPLITKNSLTDQVAVLIKHLRRT